MGFFFAFGVMARRAALAGRPCSLRLSADLSANAIGSVYYWAAHS
jgi:hypothetical protein